ncbi:MAG: adenosine kinase [Pseudomonadales bacterium]|jgi:sugar/nucleoside kinase (ribokinase family)
MNNYQIFGLGAALVDTEIEVNDQDLIDMNIDKGIMSLVDDARLHEALDLLNDRGTVASRASGGSGCNSIIAASYFGAKSYYCCQVADDENGAFFAADLRAAGVESNTGYNDPAGTTGRCLVLITPDAERTMNTCLAISETLSVAELDEAAAASADWAYIEGYQVTSATGRKAAIRLREVARAAGNKVALSLSDPAMVQFFREGMLQIIGDGVDLLFCNEQEALQFTNTESIEDAGKALAQFSTAYVITRGADGAVSFDGETHRTHSASKVRAIDTNGAGDMFAGAFLAAICQGKSWEYAGELASAASGAVVSQFGPRLKPEQHETIAATIS